KESFDQVSLLRGQVNCLGKTELGLFRRVEEKSGGAVGALMHYQSAGYEIAQAPVFGIQEHRHHPETIQEGHEIHSPHQVAGDGLKSVDGPAGIFDDSNSSPTLARRLPFPENLKQRVIAYIDDPKHESTDCHDPDRRALPP